MGDRPSKIGAIIRFGAPRHMMVSRGLRTDRDAGLVNGTDSHAGSAAQDCDRETKEQNHSLEHPGR